MFFVVRSLLITDDTQLYLPAKSNNPTNLSRLVNCLYDIKDWMSNNFLQLNSDKTEILIIGPHHLHSVNITS